MRQPKNSDELLHYWAHQVLPEAKSGNLRYQGPTLFSYAVPIAMLVGAEGVVHHTGTWSITTSAHQSAARYATRHRNRVYAPHIPTYGNEMNHRQCRDIWEMDISQVIGELQKHPRRKITLGRKLTDLCNQRRDYSVFFKLEWPEIDIEVVREGVAKVLAMEAVAAAERARRLAQDQAERAAEEASLLPDWRRGVILPQHFRFQTTALRVAGDEIETTHGALIPVIEAKLFWPLMCSAMRRGAVIDGSRDIKLGHYRLSSFNADGAGTLIVGCHTIPWSELVYIAEVLGLTPYSEKADVL